MSNEQPCCNSYNSGLKRVAVTVFVAAVNVFAVVVVFVSV